MDGSHFSDEMSDEVTIEQQRKEELAAMVPPSEGSVASGSSRRTEQWVEETCRERTNEAEEEWPNSNMTNELATEEGCSRAPLGEKTSSRLQITVDKDLTYTGNTSCARPQGSGVTRGNTRVCAYGKHKRVRPPMINVGERQVEVPRTRSVAGSVASSQRSSVYKAAILEAQAETQRALAELASTRAGCNDQHRAIAENMRTLQTTMREGLQVSDQLRTAQNTQSARVDALGHRMGEMNDLLMARELRVETQINDLSNQMHTVLNAINIMRRERSLPRQSGATEGVPVADSIKIPESSHHGRATKPELASALEPSTSKSTTPETRTKDPVLIMADVERKPARVQVRGPHDSSSMSQITSSVVRSATRDQGVDPMSPIYLDTSTEVDLSCTKATLGSQTDGAAYATAPTMASGTDSLYLTADWTAEDGMPSGAPCASSTRKKEDIANLSLRATHGSDDGTDEVTPKEGEAEVISPEQLRFTAAISKAMSKELAPLLAGRDLAQTKPSVYQGSKNGSIDGWILVMQRYLKRAQTKVSAEDRAWSIIGHLEGEARNYVINKAESERDTPEKVFELLSSRFGAGGNRMQVRQTFQSRVQQEKEDWMQYLDALEGLRSQGFPQESIITKRYEILQRFMEGVRDPVLRRELAIVYASETFLTEPPTVESLRFTTRQLQRNRPRPTQPQQPYDPRLAMRSRPHPFAPLPPNKMVMPQGVLPPPAPPQNVPAPAVPAPARAPVEACSHCGQNGHFARECPNRDQDRKPMTASEPEGVKVTTEDTTDGILEGHPGIYQCTSCGLFDQAEVQGSGVTRGNTRVCAYGKHKRVRPPMINVGERQVEVPRTRSVAGSVASSQRSSVYKAAILEAQAETQRALAELASTRAGCNDQHRAIAENMRTLQTTMREGLQVSDQLRTAQNTQSARVDALGHRMGEMKDLLMARELRVETQINDLSNQMHTVLNAINIMRRERSLPRQSGATEGVPVADSIKIPESSHHGRATKPELASALEPSTSKSTTPETRTKDPVLIMADVERKPARVQVRGPHDSSSMSQITSSVVRSATRDQGVDPMSPIYLDTSTEVDLSCTKATLGSQTDGAAYATAPTMASGTDSLYLTADWTAEDGMPSGAPCASSTRKKEDIANLSLRATHGSDDGTDEVTPKEGEAEVISPEQLRFTAAISKAMSKELAPLLAGRDLAQTKPSVYQGSKNGSIDGWILVMQRYLKRAQTKVSAEDRAWSIIGHLEGEARNYIINKAESERDTPEKVFELLSSRFGAGGNRMQVRQTFQSRVQQEKEDWMQYLDALEGLRSQGFPQESIITKRYEILQRFMEGVRDPVLRRELAIVYASETFLTEPPTVESLRFTTRQLQRNRPRPTQPQQPYDPRLAMRSRPHPFAPLPPNKMVMPQGVLPPPAPPQNVPAPAVPAPARAPVEACFHCGQNGHFARECPNRDQARKPMTASEPEGVKVTTEDTTDGILEGHPGIYQCTSCGLFDQAEVQCGEHSHAPKPSDELAYNRWAEVESAGIAAHTVPLEDDRVLMLHPAEPPAFHTPMTFTCGAKQVQTCLEPTTFDPQGRTLISIHLLLAAEQTRRPTLTLAKLWVELSILYKRNELPRPKEWYAPGESTTLTTYSPVPVCASMDGVDVKFEACVVVDVFPPGICLGPQELKCYNINHQEPTGEARIDERASLVVSFVVPHAAPIPLRGLVDTGSGVSILTFSAFNRVAARTGTVLKPYQVDLYAANGKTIKTYGLAEHIHFQLGGYELETNFVVVDDAMGVEDFLLGRNFLRSYQVLVDLTSMKIVVRAPVKPVWHHAHAQVGDTSIATPVVLDSDLVLQPFERAVARAKLVTNALEPLIFQSVALNASLSDTTLHNVVFLEDSVATVSETGTLFVSLINLTSNPQRMRCGVQLGTVVPITVVYQAVPQCLDSPTTTRTKTDADDSRANFVHKIYSEVNLSTASELTSSSEFEFLSSTDPSEAGLSEREIRKRTDPELMAPIPGPESQLQAVKDFWGASACESLSNLLDEFDELFMKHKADIGRCTIAKHTVEVEPGAVPHREGARRMSPEKAERANQEVRNLLALGMIQPSLSPWASGIVMVKKKNGELRFCCDFRPLNEVTIKDAYPLPRIDESLARLGKAKIYTNIDLAWAFWQIPVRKADRHKTAFACELGLFEWRRMPFGMCNASATFQRSIARALRNIVNREGSMVMAYIDDIVIATETVEDHMVRLREVFECLREAGFKMRVAKCDFMKSEIKYLGRVVSAEGVKPDPKAVVKLRDWEIPRNKTEMQSLLGFANYYREFIPWHAKLVAPLHAVTGLNATFAWGPEQQTAFNEIKKALIEATALAQPDSEGEFVLDTDASAVAISGILHQWQGPPGERRLRPIVYGSKKLTTTQAKYGAPKLEMFAAYYFIVKNHSYLCPRKFTLRVDNQALSWLKTYSTDQALIGRWIMTLEKYHFRVEHRPRTQHRNADGLSKRTNEYRCREKQLAQQPAAGERWNFLSADEFDKLPVAPWFDLQGRVIPNHPELPAHLQNLEPKAPNQLLRVLRRTKRASRRDRQAKVFAAPLPPPPSLALQPHEDAYPDYPEDWIDVTDEAREDYLLPTHAVNVPSRTVYAIAGANPVALQGTPSGVRDSIMALEDINTELHEHAHTVHGIKDLILAQNRDVHVLALKKLVLNEPIDHDVFPENVREFARNYYRQKKALLFINKNGVLCVRYPPNQRPLHERPCMIVMPQLYQHEILFRAHDAMGHQGISKVVARIQERHTWPGIRRSVGRYVGQCLTCQQVRDKPGDVRFHLKNIQSGYFNELVQYDHLKICPSDSNNTGILVIIDHFSKFAEAVPCNHHDYDAVTTSRLLLQKWFARHGTPTRMQSDNAPNLFTEVSNEFLKAAHVTKVISTASHPRTQGLVERQNRTLLTLLRVFCSRRMRDWDQCLDEVMGAYNSTRHATTGFSPYMLTRGVDKAIPLTFLYPEFAAKSFESHEAYVDHVLAHQQEIHDLVRRNTHQAQLRQKLKYDRAIQARAYQVGELVWVFCRYVPQKGSPKLMRAWRGPHKVVQVFQDGRVYVLNTGQKVHFERLKPHHSGPLELATAHTDSGEVVVLMDPNLNVPST